MAPESTPARERKKAAGRNGHSQELKNVQAATEWKETSPISGLPMEILEKIFEHLISQSHVYTFDGVHIPQHIYSAEWTVVTRVCSEWRNIALNSPSLWTRPSFLHQNWATEMIKRSRGLPLTIHFHLRASDNTWLIDTPHNIPSSDRLICRVAALKDLSRIESLCMIQKDDNGGRWQRRLVHTIPEMTECPAPNLRSFSLFSDASAGDILPDDLFHNNAPNLRHIQLKNWTLPWSESFLQPFSSLKTLTIQYQGVLLDLFQLKQQSISEMLSALRFLPCLEVLKLMHSLEYMEKPLPSQVEKLKIVVFPSLKHLSLATEGTLLPPVLGHIVYPASAHVRLLERGLFRLNQEYTSQILQLLDARLKDAIRYLSFNATPPRSLTASAKVPGIESLSNSTPPQNPSEFTYIPTGGFDRAAACEALSLGSLEFFKVSVVVSLDICKKIGSLESVQTLDVCGKMAKSLIPLLSETSQESGRPNEVPFFHNVKHLVIRHVGITTKWDPGLAFPENMWISADDVTNCMQGRKKSGFAIDHLELIDAVISSETISKLGSYVSNVVRRDYIVEG